MPRTSIIGQRILEPGWCSNLWCSAGVPSPVYPTVEQLYILGPFNSHIILLGYTHVNQSFNLAYCHNSVTEIILLTLGFNSSRGSQQHVCRMNPLERGTLALPPEVSLKSIFPVDCHFLIKGIPSFSIHNLSSVVELPLQGLNRNDFLLSKWDSGHRSYFPWSNPS